jgi:acyl dehydratase
MGVTITELQERVGEEVGVSEWFTVHQARIDAFADATLDHQFIHVDPERAAATPWGTTIAHGYLTLSLLPHLMSEVRLAPENTVMAINYGSDKIRFLQAVPVGSEIRARVTLTDVTHKGEGRYLVRSGVTVEIKGEERPALVAETLALFVVA